MEDKKIYPPLPSNYVTLAELQQRWLKQKEKEKEKELKQKQEEQQRVQQEQPPKPRQHNPRRNQQREPKSQQQKLRAIQSRRTEVVSATRNDDLKEFGPPNRNSSEINRVAVEVSYESESFEAKADIGDENAGQGGKKKEWKKKKKIVHRKPKADKEQKKLADDATQSTMEGAKEVESFEAKADIGDENAGQGGKKKEWKKKKKIVHRKPKADKEEKKLADDAAQSTMEGAKEVESSDVQRVDEKTEIKIESNGSKSNKSTLEVEEKLGTLSMNCGSDKQNGRLRRQYSSFRGSWGNYGGRSYSTGPYGGRFRVQEVQRQRGDNKIWVKKKEDSDGNVGGIQIASGK